MSRTLSDKWLADVPDHLVSCVQDQDCIFEKVQEGSDALQDRWIALARNWPALLKQASRKLILPGSVVDMDWLQDALFRSPVKDWPLGLSSDERAALQLLRETAPYHPSEIPRRKTQAPEPSMKVAQKVFKKLAKIALKELALPMWAAYNQISQQKAREIAPLCAMVYGSSCSVAEAEQIFQGDLERSWKVDLLQMKPVTRRVFGVFIDWVSA